MNNMGLFGFDSQAFAEPQSQHDHAALIADLAGRIVRRRMTAPAVVLLESVKPLARLGGQALLFSSPMLSLFVAQDKVASLCDFLDDRRNIELLLRAIEAREDEFVHGGRDLPEKAKD